MLVMTDQWGEFGVLKRDCVIEIEDMEGCKTSLQEAHGLCDTNNVPFIHITRWKIGSEIKIWKLAQAVPRWRSCLMTVDINERVQTTVHVRLDDDQCDLSNCIVIHVLASSILVTLTFVDGDMVNT